MNIRRYEDTVTRLENRGSHPPTREYVDHLVEGVQAGKVEACWHSAVDPQGLPLFVSKVYPSCHPRADLEAFRYLIDRVHSIGRPILSWYPLNLCRGLLNEHPDWAMKFYPMPGVTPNDDFARHYCCYNSPYGKLLPQFAAEVVRDVGFDGLWFDGSTFANHNSSPAFQPGCMCDFCRDRFARDSGLALPEKIDFADRTFRQWVNWRYDVLMDLWKRTLEAVLAVRKDAVVCFNNYRRRGTFAWATGIPMRPLGWDMLMSGELDNFPTQGDFQMKMHKAYRCRRGQDSWWPLCDHWHMWVPDMEPLTAVQAVVSTMAAGGGACTGVGTDVRLVAGPLAAMWEAGRPLLPYRDGQTIEYAAIWASQQTQDFFLQNDAEAAFNQPHGANELCLQAHLQSSVVFDDDVAGGDLSRYPVLLAGNAACVSRTQADRLMEYVRNGGVLFACDQAGEFDELGFPHERAVLDELLGICSRRKSKGSPSLIFDPAGPLADCGGGLSYHGVFTVAAPSADCEVLAPVAERTQGGWDGIETDGVAFERHAGLWRRRVGKGWAIYCAADLIGYHLGQPTARAVRLFRTLLASVATPAIKAEAPLCVTVNSRRLPDGNVAVILHNAPGTSYRYPSPHRGNYLHAPGEVNPLHDLTVVLQGLRCAKAASGVTGKALEVSADGTRVRVPRLDLYEVVVFDAISKAD